MPHRIEIINNALAMIGLTACNLLILTTWFSWFTAIPVILSTLYWIGKIKRDVQVNHNGSFKEYFKYLIGYLKKND